MVKGLGLRGVKSLGLRAKGIGVKVKGLRD